MTPLEITLSLTTAILLFVVWRLIRHQESHYHEEPNSEILETLEGVAGTTLGTMLSGNEVEIIQDARFFDEVIESIDGATSTIHVETFLWTEGKASDRIAKALAAASERGLKVRVLVDARGSCDMGERAIDTLKKANVEFHQFRSFNLMNLGRLNVRDHRKMMIFDGRKAIVGGHCITDNWLEDQEDFDRFRDVSAIFTGPIVGAIQSTFAMNWREATDQYFIGEDTFPKLAPCGDIQAHVASVKPDNTPSSVQVLHYLAIGLAKETIRIQNPYFLPDPRGIKALAQAVGRGVDVQVVTPAPHATDSTFVTYAGRRIYSQLLEAGVRIFEYQKTLLHQKIITIDGNWSGIGSCNFDDRSFEINDEVVVGVASSKVAQQLDDIFESHLEDSEEIQLESWQKRPWFERIRERFFHLLHEQF